MSIVTPPWRSPPQVTLALCLIGADFSLDIVQAVLTSKASGLVLVVSALMFASFLCLWLFGLYRRLNWLRWLTVALAAVGLLSLPWVWGLVVSNVSIYVIKYILFDAGALLLCLPQANGWYGAKSAAQ